MLELALMGPWIFFLFIGALDWGIYAYGLISMEAAARSACLYARGNIADTTGICNIVLGEMSSLPNVSSLTTCSGVLTVSATQIVGPDSANAAQVTVTYQSPSLIPIPGLLQKQFTINRTVTMRM